MFANTEKQIATVEIKMQKRDHPSLIAESELFPITDIAQSFRTPLHHAALHGFDNLIKSLINGGAMVNAIVEVSSAAFSAERRKVYYQRTRIMLLSICV